jgi:hypothetical protein
VNVSMKYGSGSKEPFNEVVHLGGEERTQED